MKKHRYKDNLIIPNIIILLKIIIYLPIQKIAEILTKMYLVALFGKIIIHSEKAKRSNYSLNKFPYYSLLVRYITYI